MMKKAPSHSLPGTLRTVLLVVVVVVVVVPCNAGVYEDVVDTTIPATFEEFQFREVNSTFSINLCKEFKSEAECKQQYTAYASEGRASELLFTSLLQASWRYCATHLTTTGAALIRATEKLSRPPFVEAGVIVANDTHLLSKQALDATMEEKRGSFDLYSRLKLKHDIDQMKYLLRKKKLPPKYQDIIDVFESIEAPPQDPSIVPDWDIVAKAEKQPAYKFLFIPRYAALMSGLYQRQHYYPLEPALRTSALSKGTRKNARATQLEYFRNEPGFTYVDDLLTKKALQQIRRFCLEATIFYEAKFNYLGAYSNAGFLAPILMQTADELAAVYPSVFKGRALKIAWAYKYDSSFGTGGTRIHADDAFVNVNFWVTPDSAFLDAEAGGGGLDVWLKSSPIEWGFSQFQDAPLLQEYVADVEKVSVPYKQNRMVFFNSNIIHQTGEGRFKPGYTNQRINVTLLFGQREADAAHAPPPGHAS